MESSSRAEAATVEHDETTPLLNAEQETNDHQSIQSKYDKLAREIFPRFSRTRFYVACGLGLVALLVLHLFFLQRTSWSRDYRRWYGLHLTGSDIKRNYLRYSGIGNTTESNQNKVEIESWFDDFGKIYSQSTTNALSSDNGDLTKYIQSKFNEFGFETTLYDYEVPELKSPVESSIKLYDANGLVYTAKLLEGDYLTPAYHGFGVSGNITSEYIFVNHGLKRDYQDLLASNFDIKGKIVILKSELDSQISLADKVYLAESYGAIGVINFLSPYAALSNSNLNLFSLAVPRDTLNGAYTKPPTIPTIPISYKSIKPILETLKHEKKVFENWDYYPYIDKFKIDLITRFDDSSNSKELTNIVGTLPGIFKDGVIVIGANRDSLVSSTSSSNHVILLEIMRNYQRLIKLGWKPLRTIRFVSWDGTENGLLGSSRFANSTILNQRVAAYLNIDSDCVTGSRFKVDANPLTHHLIKFNSRYIPLPHDNGEEYTTLHRYWSRQDNLTINDYLGISIKSSDSFIFQDSLAAPIINMKFANDYRRDKSVFVPNSNLYSQDWMVKTNMDPEYHFHSLLIRLIGLLGICLSEREMVDYKTHLYFNRIQDYFDDFSETNKMILRHWGNSTVPTNLVSNWQIYQDMNLENSEFVPFSALVKQTKKLIRLVKKASSKYDKYNTEVQQGLQTDFPWYKYPAKLLKYAQFKVANYQLLHFEQEFKLSPKDVQYLDYDSTISDHVIYGLPNCVNLNITSTECVKWSTFTNLYQSTYDKDFAATVKWLVIAYEKLRKFL